MPLSGPPIGAPVRESYAARQKYGSEASGSRGPAYFLEEYGLTESQPAVGVDGMGGVRYEPSLREAVA
jgi:hypothetical protein